MPRAWICFPGAPYTQHAAQTGAQAVLRDWDIEVPSTPPSDADATPTDYNAYIADYDLLPFDAILSKGALCSSYMIRKALIRKHYLAQSLHAFGVKRNISTDVAPRSWALDIQFADELDELLADDLYDVRDALTANEECSSEDERTWFILKPGMADQGNGIRLFSSLERLQEIFEEMEGDASDDEDDDAVYASQLRHFVIQHYISTPLLLAPSSGGMRKFHLRAYVTCVGGLQVYLHNDMLALFAPVAYTPPTEEGDLHGHLSNTCLGEKQAAEQGIPVLPSVFLFRDLVDTPISAPGASEAKLTQAHMDAIRLGAVNAIGTTFEAVAREASVHWQMWPNAFEIFGVDLMVSCDASLSPDSMRVWLLEINAQPDFKQSGAKLEGTIQHVFERAIQLGVLQEEGWPAGESRDGVTCCFADEIVKHP